MCTYAGRYSAADKDAAQGEGKESGYDSVVGILNTDWGDYGHVNHPDYSIPGMIYGAAFSWNQEIIPFEEMNRQIARVAFHDTSEQLVNLLAKAAEFCLFKWWGAVSFYEKKELGIEMPEYGVREFAEGLIKLKECEKTGKTAQVNAALKKIREQIKKTAVHMDTTERKFLADCDITLDGIEIWNEIGAAVAKSKAADDTAISDGG